MLPEFTARNVKVAAISCQDVASHNSWIDDIETATGERVSYPIFADESRDIAVMMGMLDDSNRDAAGLPLTVRSVFVVSPDKTVKLIIKYPAPTGLFFESLIFLENLGRNFDEILRCVDSLQMTSQHSLATPSNWQKGFIFSFDIVFGKCLKNRGGLYVASFCE